jgi:DNA-binding PadR family transcriptional regulator
MYVLLALCGRDMHAHELRAAAINMSLEGLKLSSGQLHNLLLRLAEDGFITDAGEAPSGPSGRLRRQIAITEWGRTRLQEDLLRMRHAVEVGEGFGLVRPDSTITEIRRLKLAQRLDLGAD